MENILGNRLPVELQRKISLHMEHPVAEIIKNHIERMGWEVEKPYIEKDIADDCCMYDWRRDDEERQQDYEKMMEELKIENLVSGHLMNYRERAELKLYGLVVAESDDEN